jgi:CelD/BcsL family acetyltransferase involved in cellulose biosynthesis
VTLARLPFRVFQLCGCGIVGDHSEASRLFTALAETSLHYDGLSLEETPIDSMLWKASRMKHKNLLVFERSRAPHYVVDLPSNYASYFQQLSGKTRTNIRRGMKELGDRLGHWAVRKFTAPGQVREMIGLIETVATKTFHYRLLGQDLTASNQQLIDNLTLCAQKGWLRGYLLVGDDRAIAYAIGYLINGCYQYELVGYHPELAHASPGMVLLAKIIEDLIGSRAADLLDFGAGDALYKQLFGNRYYEEGAALICRRAPYAAGAAIAERLLAEASKLGARALARTGLKIRLKKLLRSNAEHAVSWSSHRDGVKGK